MHLSAPAACPGCSHSHQLCTTPTSSFLAIYFNSAQGAELPQCQQQWGEVHCLGSLLGLPLAAALSPRGTAWLQERDREPPTSGGVGPSPPQVWSRPRGAVGLCQANAGHGAAMSPRQQPPPARSVRRQPRCAALLVPAPGTHPHARDVVGALFPRPPHRAALRLLRAGGEVPGPAAPSCGQIKADAWGSWGAGTGRCRDFFPSFFSPC